MAFRRLLTAVAVLLIAVSAFAQTTGSLTGRVTMDGNALPGVTVTVSSPNLQGTRTTVTDVNGNYNFGALPPGEYTVRFEMESMSTVTRTTRLGVSQRGAVDAEMRLTTVAEAITVTAAAPAVLETTEIQTNIEARLQENLPIGRRPQDAVLLSPGVTNTGPNAGTSITIQGAPAYDSVFMVNGAVINENLRGQAHNLFIEDAVQETTVLVGAISAEYGRFTGGVVNAITKSGGNEFHGSLRDSLTSDEWTAYNDDYFDFYEIEDEDRPTRSDVLNNVYEATLGGRIIRDRLWFFAAGRQFNRAGTLPLNQSPAEGSTPGPTYNFTNEETRYEGKLTGQITSRHTLVGSYLDIKNPATNNCFIACLEFSNLDAQRDLPNSFAAAHYNGVITNNFLIEGHYSKKEFAFVGSGGDFRDDRIKGTAWYDYSTGYFFGAPVFCGTCGDEERNNDLWTAKATYYLASQGLGTHTLVAGAENWMETRFSNNYQSASNYFLNTHGASPVCRNGACFPTFQNGDIIQYSPISTLSQGSDFQTFSAFLNDKWDLNRHFSFNLGVRYDANEGIDSSGATVSKDSAISPRLGAIWDIAGNGRFRVNASYSKYVSRIPETIGGGGTGAGNPATIYYEYRGPTINANNTLTTEQVAAQVFQWFDANGGLNNSDLIVFARIPGLNTVIRDELKSPNVDEYTVGFGTQLMGGAAFARVDLTRREWNDFYAIFRTQDLGSVADQFGQKSDLGEIRNSNEFVREYDAVTLQAAYRPQRWQRVNIGANYTWSELTGNVTAETSGSGPVSEARFSYPEYRNFARNNPIGNLSQDQTHKVRAWISYDQPTPIGNFNFSVLQRFDSGTPYSAVGSIDTRFNATLCPTCPDPVLNAGATNGSVITTYVTAPTNVPYYFSDRGEFRWDDVTATDLAVNYELPISRIGLFVQAELVNMFNEQAQVAGDVTVQTHRQDSTLQRFDPFTTTPIEGVHWRKAASFGDPLNPTGGSNTNGSYQLPRTYRFSLGLRF
jgi:outer membrane receptor protein involved in Fe transport